MKDPSTLMRTPATGPPPRTGVRPPVVERIAGWSARHRAIALIGWLMLVAGAVVVRDGEHYRIETGDDVPRAPSEART